MPTVVTSVLFTDLVGSTALAQRLGPEAAEDLRRTHFALLRGAIRAAGGDEVKNLGDGIMVTFSSTSRALACAVGMQQAIDHHNRRGGERLGLRVGLSVGEATQEEGDVFGEPVVEASRLCGAAGAGQILTSELVHAMVARHATYSLVPIGELELKGITDPVSAYEVVWEPEAAAGAEVPLPARLVSAATDSLFGFFGRQPELDAVDAALKRCAETGSLEVVLVAGEAGIGKTALVAQTARAAHSAGVTVLFGRCQEDLATPYRPWSEALQHLVEARAVLLDELAVGQREVLAHVLPGGTTGTSASGGNVDEELVVLPDAVASLLAHAAKPAPLMVVLDDLHWGDQASLQLIRYLARGSAQFPLLLVATYRDSDVAAADPLADLLADLRRETGVSRLTLHGLGDTDLVELIAAAAGYELDERAVGFAHAVSRETDGNPFFAGELLRHLGETGAIFLGEDGRWEIAGELDELGLPGSIREVVGKRVRGLGDPGVRLLSLASVIGRDFDLDLLADVAETDEDQVLELLETATVAALVSEHDEFPGRYRFTHALIQHTLYQDLSTTRRQRTHYRVAAALEARDHGDEHASELARHWMAATHPADLDKALHYAERAAEVALRSLAPDDAISWYAQALELVARQPSSPDDTRRARLLLGLGTAERLAGRPSHRETLLEAARLGETLGDVDTVVNAVVTNAKGLSGPEPADEERLAMAGVALELVGPSDSVARARILAVLTEYSDPLDWQSRMELADRAVAVAQRAQDPPTLLRVEAQTAATRAQPERHDERLATTAEMVALADRLGDPVARFNANYGRLELLGQTGDLDAMNDALATLAAIVADTAYPYHLWQLRLAQTGRALLAGDLAAAETLADEALNLGTRNGHPNATAAYGGQLATIRQHQGRLDEVIEFFAQAAADNPSLPALQISVASMQCELGDLDEARRLYAPVAERGLAAIPRDLIWMLGMDRLSRVAVALGDRAVAPQLYDLLAPFGHLVATAGPPAVLGSVSHPLGNLARTLGDYERAETHLRRAQLVHERLDAPYPRAVTDIDYAVLLLDDQPARDPDRAAELLRRAETTAAAHGYRGLERRIAAVRG